MTQIQWGVVLTAWLLGVAVEYQQLDLQDGYAQSKAVLILALIIFIFMQLWRGLKKRPNFTWPDTLLLSLVVAMLGWAYTNWQASARWDMKWPVELNAQTVILSGQIDSMPKPNQWGKQIEVLVKQVQVKGQLFKAGQPWVFAPGLCPDRVSLMWGKAPENVLPGQIWQWSVQLHAPDGLVNPGGFDAQKWSFIHGIRAQGKVKNQTKANPAIRAPILLESPTYSSPGLIDRLRLNIANRIMAEVENQDTAGFLIGLTVGQQSAVSAKDWQILRDTGIAHLASISGLHITMMGWVLGHLAAQLWRLHRALISWMSVSTVKHLGALLGAASYAMLAGWGIPAQRTVWMLAWVVLLQFSGKRWPFALVLLMAAVVVTVLDPWALMQASFWLSFAAVGFLMLTGDHPSTDALLGWRARAIAAFKNLLHSQAIATFGLAPLSLIFFQTFSVFGLLTNLVCIPLFTLIITPLALLGLLWSNAWNTAAWLLEHILAVLQKVALHPWALWQGQEIEAWAALLAMMGMVWIFMPIPWRWRLMAWPTLLPLLFPHSLSQSWPRPPKGEFQIIAADIGQGTSVLVRTSQHALLYDTGQKLSEEFDMGSRVLVGLLRSVGVKHLDELMISHADSDHVGGAASVIAQVEVRTLRSSLPSEHPLFQATGRNGKAQAVPCLAGQQWVWDDVQFEVIYPDHEWSQIERQAQGDNASSCVLRVRAHGRQILLTGDIEAQQERQLVSTKPHVLRSEVLLAPHHGSKTSSTAEFLQAVAPQVAIVQAGVRNRYGHPHQTVLQRYQSLGIYVVQSSTCGAWWWQSDGAVGEVGVAGAVGAVGSQSGQCMRFKQNQYWAN